MQGSHCESNVICDLGLGHAGRVALCLQPFTGRERGGGVCSHFCFLGAQCSGTGQHCQLSTKSVLLNSHLYVVLALKCGGSLRFYPRPRLALPVFCLASLLLPVSQSIHFVMSYFLLKEMAIMKTATMN